LQKVIYIIFIFILSTGCSVIRNGSKNNYKNPEQNLRDNLLEKVKGFNISRSSFYIQKADIEIANSLGKQNLTGTIKYLISGTYLISIKSKSGIEGARIFLSKDTILVNDRINRNIYYGSPKWIKEYYGLEYSILPVMLGDYMDDLSAVMSVEKCLKGKVIVDYVINNKRIVYNIDCKLNKIVSAYFLNNENEGEIEILYDRFFKKGEILAPGIVQIRIIKKDINVKIRIRKIQFPWDGIIDFVPGRKYELIKLI
jgi:hypothetical protein